MDPHQRKGVIVTAVTTIVIPTITIALRCLAVSTVRKQSFGWDDYLAIATLPFIITIAALTIALVAWDAQHGPEAFAHGIPDFIANILITIQALYVFGLSLPRLSIVCFYYKIFGRRDGWFFNALRAIGGVCIGWLIVNFILGVSKCIPLKEQFNMSSTPHGTCINLQAHGIFLLGSSIIIDLVLLIMPMPLIFKINAPLSKRISVALIFLCGGTVIIFTVGRLVLSIQAGPDVMRGKFIKGGPIATFIQLEAAMSLVSVSLPKIFTLFRHLYDQGIKSLTSKRSMKTDDSNPHMSDYNRLKRSGVSSANTKHDTSGMKDSLTRSSHAYAEHVAATTNTSRSAFDDDLEKLTPIEPAHIFVKQEYFVRKDCE